MITKIGRFTLIAGITLGLVLKTAPPAEAKRLIICESQNGRYNFCRVDTRGGVEIRRQLSNASCRFNRSWGYNRDGIWVNQGCRARFVIRGRGGRRPYYRNDYRNDYRNNRSNRDTNDTAAIVGGVLAVGAIAAALAANSDNNRPNSSRTTLNCSSNNNNYARCPTSIRGRVYLKRQLSRAGCWEGSTWGYDPGGIWVDRGCRGEFEIER